MDISERLRTFCEEHGITQTYISEQTDIPQPVISRLFNDQRRPDIHILEKVCNVLNIKIYDLFREDVSPLVLTPEQKELLRVVNSFPKEKILKLIEFLKLYEKD